MSWKVVCVVLFASMLVTSVFASSYDQDVKTDLMRAVEIEKRADGIRFDLELADPVMVDVPIDMGLGQVLEIPGASMIQEEGMPTVPILTRMFRMPPAGGAQAVVLNAEYETMTGLEYAAYMGMEGDEFIFGELDNTIDEWYPDKIAEVTDAAIARQFRIANLVTYPVRVNAYRNEVRVYSGIEVDVQYGGTGENELSSYPTALSASYLSFYENFLDWDTDELDGFEIYHGAVQVVAKDAALAGMEDWIEWKRQKGYKLEFITDSMVSWSASAIKAELQSRWDSSEYKFDWVVIVGDDGGSYATPPGQGIGDHNYIRLAGNDQFPEAGIGRISVDNAAELTKYERKVLFYERDPYMGDTGWYQRGVVGAGSSSSGVSTIYLGRYARHAMLDLGYTQVDTAWYNDGGGNVNNRNAQSVENGVSFFSYRGYLGTGMSNSTILGLDNDFMLPMVLTITCGEGNWTGGDGKNEAWINAGSANVPTGGIGAIATATSGTHTRYNNSLSGGGIFSNLVLRNKEMGAVIFWSKVNLYNAYYPWQSGSVTSFCEWTNMMGDPSVWLWTDVPRPLEVTHPSNIEYGRNGYEVVVTDDLGIAEPGAWVCLYKNDANDDTVAFGETDANGRVLLDIPFDGIGTAKLTVTKQNHHPYQVDIPCEVNALLAIQNVQIIDNGQGGSSGDGDGLAEPGEVVGLRITLENLTGNDVDDIGAIFTSDDPMVQNTSGVALFGGNFPAGEVRQATSLALIQITDDAQSSWIVDGVIGIGVIPVPGDPPNVTEEDYFTFRINAPEFTYVNHTPDGTIIPGATVDISFDIANIGLSPGIAGQAQLISDDMYLTVNSGQQPFPAAAVGATVTTSGHTISAHSESFKGYPAKARLIIGNAEGYLDTVSVTIPLGTRTATDPVGPDEYGYIAFEDRDTDYDIAPVYDWVEIDPDIPGNDYTGILLDINDSSEEDDDAVVVDLPFNMRYYGVNFDQMTITCNGFVSMGNQSDMRTPRNWPIPSPLGPNYMIAPYWDDRKIDGPNSGVFHYYDEPNGRYIIEWHSVGDENGPWNPSGAWNTFQMIVYDQVGEHITISGNANILFQYEDVTHTDGDSPNNDYMTVGVENGDQTVGLQIAYWDSDDAPGATITNERAILITTQAALITGTVSGTVTLATGGDPVEGALVSTGDNSYFDYTNDLGQYLIEEIVIGEHDLVVSMQGINSQNVEILVEEDLVTTQNFSVTAPGWDTSVDEVVEALPGDDVIISTVTLSNPGDGELDWSVVIDNEGPDGQSTDGWFDLNDEFELDGSDNRNSGLTFHKGYFWVSGANNFQNPNYLYRVNMDGTIVESYEQPVPNPSDNGFSCLTTDGDYLYGVDDGKLFEMEYDEDTGALSLISQVVLTQEFEYVGFITYDKESDLFWLGEHYTPLYAITRDGTIVHEYDLDMPFLAMGYYSEDADGYNLYGVMQETPYVDMTVIKIDPDNGDTLFVTNIEADVYAIKDVHITYLWDPFFWSFILLKNGSMLNDRVEVYELEPNIAWLNLSSPGGQIQPGGDFPLDVNIASLDLPEGEYSSWLHFTTNTYEPEIYMPVTLTIDNDLEVEDGDGKEAQPLDWVFEGVYPNPFNPTATVSFTMKHTANAKATLYNVLGQQVTVVVDEVLTAGHHQLLLNGDNLASGVYFLRFQAGPMSETRKVVLMR